MLVAVMLFVFNFLCFLRMQLDDIVMTDGRVTAVRLSKTDKPGQVEVLPCQAVILATGGYSASKKLLKVCVYGVCVGGCEYFDSVEMLPCQAVILATGGYSASKELLKVCVYGVCVGG